MNGSFSVLGKIGWLALICSQALSLTACDSPSDLSGTLDLSGPSHVMELRAPESLLPRNIDPNALQPRATLNGEDFGFRPLPNSDIWRGEATVPQGTTVTLSIEWIERFDNRDLTLAIFERTFENVSAQIALNLIDRDYVIDDIDRYPKLDEDLDGVANLVERREGSDPIDRFDPGEFRAGAFIPYRSRAATLRIDGAYDTTWDTAQFQGNDGIDLFIHNRMVGNDPMRSDGNTEYRWAAMHDGRYLYLFVVGAEGDIHTPWGDSLEPWMDDAIDIFLDGNRSRGDTYDGVDDYHIIIPLLKLNQGEGASNRSIDTSGTADPSGRFSVGFNSLPVPPNAIDFATCAVCPIADAYEIRLDMQAFGIPVDRSFGFEVQINDDVDSGERDFKFGWAHPSAAPGVAAFDETWRNPSLMGLIELRPPGPESEPL